MTCAPRFSLRPFSISFRRLKEQPFKITTMSWYGCLYFCNRLAFIHYVFNLSSPPSLAGQMHRRPPREARGSQQGYLEGRRGTSHIIDTNPHLLVFQSDSCFFVYICVSLSPTLVSILRHACAGQASQIVLLFTVLNTGES